jgi:hypothetical protein
MQMGNGDEFYRAANGLYRLDLEAAHMRYRDSRLTRGIPATHCREDVKGRDR